MSECDGIDELVSELFIIVFIFDFFTDHYTCHVLVSVAIFRLFVASPFGASKGDNVTLKMFVRLCEVVTEVVVFTS